MINEALRNQLNYFGEFETNACLPTYLPTYLILTVDPCLTEKRVDRKKTTVDRIFFLSKTVRFVWNNSNFGACVSVFTAC